MQDQRLGVVLWRGRWLIVAAVIVSVIVAVAATKLTSKTYQATALLQVNQSGQVGANASDIFNAQQASQNLAVTYATEIGSSSFLDRIRPQVAGGQDSTASLEAVVTASAVTNTGLVAVSAKADSPAKARALAQGVAQAFLTVLSQDGNAQAAAQQRVLEGRIASLSASVAALRRSAASGDPAVTAQLASERQALSTMNQQVGTVLAGGSLQGVQVSLVGPPTAASAPVSPRPVLNLAAGVLLGLLIGCGLAWLQVRLDTGLHSADEAAAILQVPMLASIPTRRRSSGRQDPLQDRIARDAYDVLQTNLRFSSIGHSSDVIALTSYSPGEGKSSVAEGLADAALRSGQHVLLVDGDLRSRTLSQTLGYGTAPGVTSMIVGDETDAVVELGSGLFFLPAGPPSPNPVSLLYSRQTRQLLDEIRSRYSMVIIDAPAAAHLADASVWAALSDCVIVVARVGVTKRAQLAALGTELGPRPMPVIGVVVFEPRTDDVRYGAAAKAPDSIPNLPVHR